MAGMIRINGEPVEPFDDANIVEVEPGVYSVVVEGRSYDVRIAADEVSVNGHRMAWELDDPRVWKGGGAAAGTKGRAAIKAPMPGKIVKVLVNVGDQVQAGQGILLMEAMKMQNELKSPKAGIVVAIDVEVGASVTAGTILGFID